MRCNVYETATRSEWSNAARSKLKPAIGGHWAGRHGIDDAAFPQAFEIDYVCVYQNPEHQMTGHRALADEFDAKVLLEPFYRVFLATAKRVRLFLEEVNSPRIRALLDPANLIEVNDLEEMFHQLGPWIDCLHAKDRKLHTDLGVAAGQGDLAVPGRGGQCLAGAFLRCR